jgi:hypothetical protein
MARAPYVDPNERARIDAQRQAYYESLRAGTAQPKPSPQQDFTQTKPDADPLHKDLRASPDALAGTVSRGALIDDPAQASTSQEPPVNNDGDDGNIEQTGNTGNGSAAPVVFDDGPITIPDNYLELSWNQQRQLAKSLAPDKVVTNRSSAVATIEAEVERRKADTSS